MKERLRSRFEWGLVADLQPPDFETRLGILQNKAQHDEITINNDVLEYIALQVKENIRALEGSLNRVVAYSKLLNTAVTPDIAARALADIASKEPKLAPDHAQSDHGNRRRHFSIDPHRPARQKTGRSDRTCPSDVHVSDTPGNGMLVIGNRSRIRR